MFSPRLNRRLLRHHFPIGTAVLICGAALYVTRPYPDMVSRLSFASAYPALILIAATLLIGPLKFLFGVPLAASLDFRRDTGIWAGMAGIFHAGIGQCVHLRGRPWLYYIYENWRQTHLFPVRHDVFGLANDTGLAATLILIVLLATSNDASLRKLGTPGWKKLQRWNYYCFALTAVHTFAYQEGVESQQVPFLATAIATVLITLVLQLAGLRARRRALNLAE
ncbi:MAG TPA: ferric reductase-like transmembrane domain-containing protein [Rhizomicrobium sp.]|jgi:sulfoxide reductase heme-binding subunit YedZ|nr:ferric reductase-like transmembrane domain-containing protein [Rhizomicrobium sp.]